MTFKGILLISFALYGFYKIIEFIIRKIFGGRTTRERIEEKRLRKQQIEESISLIVDSVSL